MTLGEHRTHHVGLEKYKVSQHDFTHFGSGHGSSAPRSRSRPPGISAESIASELTPGYGPGRIGSGTRDAAIGDPSKLNFSLMEPEPEKLTPSFNVLYVRAQKPGVLRLPLVRLFLQTWGEMVDLLRPVLRFGIPESSLRDKCKYWRDDGSSLTTTPSLQTQRLMKAINSEAFGSSRAAQQHQQNQHKRGQGQAHPPAMAGSAAATAAAEGAAAAAASAVVAPEEGAAAAAAVVGAHVAQADLARAAAASAVAAGAAAARGPLQAHGLQAQGHRGGHGHSPHGHGAHGHGAHGHGGHGHGKRHLTPFQEKEEFVEAVTPWVVFGLNVAAWCYLGASANKTPPGM